MRKEFTNKKMTGKYEMNNEDKRKKIILIRSKI
jgi:hypothetical protein